MLLEINGTLKLNFFELNGIAEVTPERKKDIEDKLQSGEYIITLSECSVVSLPNLQEEAKFKFDVCDDTEYSFVKDESDED